MTTNGLGPQSSPGVPSLSHFVGIAAPCIGDLAGTLYQYRVADVGRVCVCVVKS